MSIACLVFVCADGSTERTLVESFPGRWKVRNGIPFERGDIAWKKDEEENDAHGAMVYIEVEPRRYFLERNRQREAMEAEARAFADMPGLATEEWSAWESESLKIKKSGEYGKEK